MAVWCCVHILLATAQTCVTLRCSSARVSLQDGNWGVGVNIPKYVFDKADKKPYVPKVICGSSTPVGRAGPGLALPGK
jgi:hypothetical protein